MEINLFEIIAQIINFFVLLFVLQKLFYKPVINAMKNRQNKIAEKLNSANEKMEEASSLITDYNSRLSEISKKEKELLEAAKKEAFEEKESLLEKYKEEVETARKSYYKELSNEKSALADDIRNILGESAVKIASKILSVSSSDEILDNMFENFISEIINTSEATFEKNISSADNKIIICSSHEINEKHKEVLKKTIEDKIRVPVNIVYETDENLILGYKLSVEAFSLNVNAEKYLKEFKSDVDRIIPENSEKEI